MKILLLVNWKIKYTDKIPPGIQPPDYFVDGRQYWFFKFFKNRDFTLDVMDISSFGALERFEKNKLRFYVWQALKAFPKLKNYDVVLSHGMQSGVVIAILRRLFGKGKYKHIVFDIGAFNSARETGKALKLMQFAAKSLDGVIYHTPRQKAYYEKCHPGIVSKSIFIPFGTDTEFFKKVEPNKSPIGEKYIISVGYNKRDWDTLIKAYDKSLQKYQLLLIGNDSYHSDNSNIRIMPPVSLEKLMNYISNSEFCVLPLENFNYSYGQMTLLQQMAMGKAVLCAEVNSLEAYTSEGIKRDALKVYSPKNEAMLTRTLNELMSNPPLCERIGANASSLVRELFDEKTMAVKIEDYIYSVLGK